MAVLVLVLVLVLARAPTLPPTPSPIPLTPNRLPHPTPPATLRPLSQGASSMRGSTFILAAAVTALLSGCSRPAPVGVPAPDAAAHTFQWPAWGRDAGGSRFAPLAHITPANVAALTPA